MYLWAIPMVCAAAVAGCSDDDEDLAAGAAGTSSGGSTSGGSAGASAGAAGKATAGTGGSVAGAGGKAAGAGGTAAGAGGAAAGAGGSSAGAGGSSAGAGGSSAGAGGSSAGAAGAAGGGGASPQVARGEYLVKAVLACGDCHTPRDKTGAPDMSKWLSGVPCFIDADPTKAGFGCLSTRNLTNHATGLSTRTDQQVKDMMLNGVRPDGKALSAVMPYYQFHNMKPEDADAIVAYLRTVPGVDNTLPAHEPPWDNIPAPAPSIDPSTLPTLPSTYADVPAATRGRYLAAEAGACLECHTKHNAPGAGPEIDVSKAFQGGVSYQLGLPSPPFPATIYSANLTPHATGLAGWTVADVVKALKEGKDKTGGNICPPMPAGKAGFAGLTEGDATDIAHYILSLAPADNAVPNGCVAP